MTKKKLLTKEDDKSIFKSWSSIFSDTPGGDMNEYREYIFERIKFSKVLHTLKLQPVDAVTDRYTHKMICPFKFHKNGRERTGSFRFSDKKQVFTCFGCNCSGDVLKFLSLYCGGDDQFNLKRLAGIAGLLENVGDWIPNVDDEDEYREIGIREANHQKLFDTGLLLRDYLNSVRPAKIYSSECEWVDNMFIKIDKCFAGFEQDNIEEAQKMYDDVNKAITKRKNKNGA
jgi:hypothetical protein